MIKYITLLFTTLFLLNFSCSTSKLQTVSLDNTSWQLQSMMGKEVNENITLSFKQGKISGKSFCNNYFSECTIKGKKLKVEAVGATKRACPDLEKEKMYFNLLIQVQSYKMKDGQLYLEADKGNLVFQPFKPKGNKKGKG